MGVIINRVDIDDLEKVAGSQLINRVSALEAQAGDESLDTTAQTLSGAVNELNDAIEDIAAKNPCKYSTTEKIVGEWIDGKPIYEKTWFSTAVMTLNATTTTYVDIEDLTNYNIDNIIDINGGYTHATNGAKWAFNMANTANGFSMSVLYNENKLLRVHGYRETGTGTYTNFIITIRYTKTTD